MFTNTDNRNQSFLGSSFLEYWIDLPVCILNFTRLYISTFAFLHWLSRDSYKVIIQLCVLRQWLCTVKFLCCSKRVLIIKRMHVSYVYIPLVTVIWPYVVLISQVVGCRCLKDLLICTCYIVWVDLKDEVANPINVSSVHIRSGVAPSRELCFSVKTWILVKNIGSGIAGIIRVEVQRKWSCQHKALKFVILLTVAGQGIVLGRGSPYLAWI